MLNLIEDEIDTQKERQNRNEYETYVFHSHKGFLSNRFFQVTFFEVLALFTFQVDLGEKVFVKTRGQNGSNCAHRVKGCRDILQISAAIYGVFVVNFLPLDYVIDYEQD